MKKIVTILTMALLFSVCSATAISAKPMHGKHYVDADGNGVCDNYGSHSYGHGIHSGHCKGYTDTDGDGVCDNYGSHGYGCGTHSGYGNGYADADGDGVCDNIKYSIKYNLNGGKNNKKNPSCYYNTSKTIKLKNPTKKGYTFKGWYTNQQYGKKVTMIKKGSTGKKIFYAKWQKK